MQMTRSRFWKRGRYLRVNLVDVRSLKELPQIARSEYSEVRPSEALEASLQY